MTETAFSSLLWLLVGLSAGGWLSFVLLRRTAKIAPQAVAAPAASSNTLSPVAEVLPVPSIVIDERGSVAYTNPAAVKAFGPLNPGTLLFLKFRAPEMRFAIESALATHENTSFEMVERLPVEQWFRVDVCHMPPHLALFFRDQSESHKLDRMRSDFVANASHELRTPLASMTGFIETLKGPARNDAVARDKFLTIMQQQGERMARLIDDLLSLSRLEMRPVVSLDRTVDLQSITEHVLDAMRPLAAELGVSIERNFEGGPFTVPGVRDELIQVVENLIENGCKYGQSGKKVVVSLSRNADDVRLGIKDFGPGISAEHLPRLTERFYRVDVGTSRAQKGTGLGLAIVKHILTRHQARLSIQSEPGSGSEFIVNFPGGGFGDKNTTS
jgi:two-component system, OmpR family, phosphate regulon sensor histidine kinase PhoR